MSRLFILLLMVFASTFVGYQNSCAQTIEQAKKPATTINGDSLFLVARDSAFAGSYLTARKHLRILLKAYPNYYDAFDLMSRTYAWEGKYDSSLTLINQTLKAKSDLESLQRFKPVVLHWSNQNKQAQAAIDAIQANDTEEDLELKFLEAKVQKELSQLDAALTNVNELIQTDTSNQDYKTLKSEIEKLRFGTSQRDSLFTEAQTLAYSGEYLKARKHLNTILDSYPEDYDALELKARAYAWEGELDSSLTVIDQTLSKNDSLETLKRFKPEVLHWSKRNEEAQFAIDQIQETDTVEDLKLKFLEAKVQKELYLLDTALSNTNQLLETDSTNQDYVKLKEEIERLMLDQTLGVIYGYDFFSNVPNSPRHSVAIEYQKRTKGNIFIARVTYANRFGLDDILLEIDDYPSITEKLYLYTNIAFSPTRELFPRIRLGLEPYYNLGKGFEISAGYRFLFFDRIGAQAQAQLDSLENPRFGTTNLSVHLFTASLGKYFGKNYLLGRAYAGRNNIDQINAFELLYRRFGKMPRTYLEAKIGFGNSPDEAYLESSLVELGNNRSRFALLGYSHQFNHKWYARIWGIYDRQMPDRVNADFDIISGYLGVWWNF